MSFSQKVKCLCENIYLNFLVGMILLYTAVAETLAQWHELETVNIGVHHGVMLAAFLHLVKIIPDLFEALEKFSKP